MTLCALIRFRASGTNRSGAGDVAQGNLDPPIGAVLLQRENSGILNGVNESKKPIVPSIAEVSPTVIILFLKLDIPSFGFHYSLKTGQTLVIV